MIEYFAFQDPLLGDAIDKANALAAEGWVLFDMKVEFQFGYIVIMSKQTMTQEETPEEECIQDNKQVVIRSR
jgi:hypothetical protein